MECVGSKGSKLDLVYVPRLMQLLPLDQCLSFSPGSVFGKFDFFSHKKKHCRSKGINKRIHLCVQYTFCGDTCATAERSLTDTNLHTVQLKFQATISSLDLSCP